ncbi:M13 family metallopeptidase [Phytohalomonas tamaricis]|uniref:M13 family metallopeptidase n=1 Tax=Phytohalomonas tamaricis TaxID=2081032 RepID=UPI000D0B554C|nr:M13-type metalloendopeptidase [Phytohalomonas tamaricis]
MTSLLRLIVCTAVASTIAAPPLYADATSSTTTSSASAASSTGQAQLGAWGVELNARDTAINPGDDFYHYVNGHWLATTPIPADKSNYGAFTELADQAEQQVHDILEQLAGAPTPLDSPQRRIGDLYSAWMDKGAIEAAGLAPIQPDLRLIDQLNDKAGVARLMGQPGLGIGGIAEPYIDIDVKDTDSYVTYLGQAALGLPTRDYYLSDDPRFQNIRKAYRAYIARLLKAAHASNPQASADQILALETRMAQVQWAPAKQRNRSLTYNPTTPAELATYAPGFPWQAYLEASGLLTQSKLVLQENDAIKALAQIFADTPLSVWKRYLTFSLLNANADYLPQQFDQAHFDFYGKTLSGQPEQRARWKRGVALLDAYLGQAVGKLYVMLHFSPDAKAQMQALVDNLKAAYRDRIENSVTWMSPETKQAALAKLDAFNAKIAYPDKWETYDGMRLTPDHLYADIKAARAWHWQDDLDKLGSPIDRDEWFMTPQTVNAYYEPTRNEIVFPAAILQPPFFDPNADPAVNYGGIGAVIGHEMSHGFDDQGRKSDGHGMLRDWWTPKDIENFTALTDRLGAQYAQYEPVPGYHLDPQLTMGENIGDLGGLNIAYAAYHRSLNGQPAPVLDGFTGDQRFFMAWAQVWRRLFREEAMVNRVKTDPHSPSEFRANGVVRNMDAWYKAFYIKPGDALYLPPEERVTIW